MLVVDDEPQIRRAVRNALSAGIRVSDIADGSADERGQSRTNVVATVRVLEASTGREAIDLAATEAPAMIILDLGLPDMAGLAVCREIRRFSSFRAYHDAGFDSTQTTSNSRLIGRSVWNTEWMLIIPGGTFLSNPDQGLDTFINSVSDIKIFFQTYAYSGN